VSHIIEFNGHTDTVVGWSRRIGIHKGTLNKRFQAGWTAERALTTPTRRLKPNRAAVSPAVQRLLLPALDQMKRNALAERRELTRMLRQFSRDFAMIMERSMHRRVVADFKKQSNDRTLFSIPERT
jgi:hypothetical protein